MWAANLQDHISAGILWRRTEPGPLRARMRLDRIAVDLAKTYFFGSGISAELPGGAMAFLRSPLAGALPDVQFLFVAAPLTARPYLPPFTQGYADSFACRAVVLRPESRGRLDLVSADPRRPMRIRQNFLATEKDWAILRAGLRLARDVAKEAPLRPFIAEEVAPGTDKTSDRDIDAHIRATGISVHHPLGTFRMGTEDDGDWGLPETATLGKARTGLGAPLLVVGALNVSRQRVAAFTERQIELVRTLPIRRSSRSRIRAF